jgi:putative Holliday junction resolvase
VRVLALDYGSARCGVAVSDPTGVLATPLEPVLKPAGRKGMGKLLALVHEVEAERVIVGLPLSLSVLEQRLGGVPVELYDERFTTLLAQRDGIGSPRSRPTQRPRASEDSRAAAHLLSNWLDRHAHT